MADWSMECGKTSGTIRKAPVAGSSVGNRVIARITASSVSAICARTDDLVRRLGWGGFFRLHLPSFVRLFARLANDPRVPAGQSCCS
jgi:hypothetical protein